MRAGVDSSPRAAARTSASGRTLGDERTSTGTAAACRTDRDPSRSRRVRRCSSRPAPAPGRARSRLPLGLVERQLPRRLRLPFLTLHLSSDLDRHRRGGPRTRSAATRASVVTVDVPNQTRMSPDPRCSRRELCARRRRTPVRLGGERWRPRSPTASSPSCSPFARYAPARSTARRSLSRASRRSTKRCVTTDLSLSLTAIKRQYARAERCPSEGRQATGRA